MEARTELGLRQEAGETDEDRMAQKRPNGRFDEVVAQSL